MGRFGRVEPEYVQNPEATHVMNTLIRANSKVPQSQLQSQVRALSSKSRILEQRQDIIQPHMDPETQPPFSFEDYFGLSESTFDRRGTGSRVVEGALIP